MLSRHRGLLKELNVLTEVSRCYLNQADVELMALENKHQIYELLSVYQVPTRSEQCRAMNSRTCNRSCKRPVMNTVIPAKLLKHCVANFCMYFNVSDEKLESKAK